MKYLLMLSFLALLGCNSKARVSDKASTRVKLALTNVPLSYLPVIAAQQLNFFAKEGLTVDVEDFSSASQVMQAVLAGSTDVAAGTFEQTIQLATEGRHVKAFALFLQQASRVLVALPVSGRRLRDVQDLKGKVVGVAGLGSANHLFLNYLLSRYGVKPTEVKVVAIGVGMSAIAALTQRRVEAALLVGSEPEVALAQIPNSYVLLDARGPENCKRIFGTEDYPGPALVATGDWLKKNPGTARKLAGAIQASLRWIKKTSPEEILNQVPQRYRMTNHAAEMQTLRRLIPGYSPDGFMSREEVETVRKMVGATVAGVRDTSVDLSQSYTNEFLAH